MRRDEIIAKWERLSPRERDTWIAEVIFGSTVHHEYSPDGPIYLDATTLLSGRRHIRNYTTDISAAWAVIDTLRKRYYYRIWSTVSGKNAATFLRRDNNESQVGYAPTAPEAICLAALIAKLTEGAD